MRNRVLQNLYIPGPRLNRYNILRQLNGNCRLTQAEIAQRCDLSVAMVNNYMKELCELGLVEYRRKSAKVVTYHVTAQGHQHVAGVQQSLMQEVVRLYVQAKEQIRAMVMTEVPGARKAILCGRGSLAEMTLHALEGTDNLVIGICDPDPAHAGSEWCGHEVLDPSQIRYTAPDVVIIADENRPDDVYRDLRPLQERGVRLLRLDRQLADRNSAWLTAAMRETEPDDDATDNASLVTNRS